MRSGPRYFAAAIVGFAFAQLVGSNADTIARALLFVNSFLFRDGEPLREYQVEETTLHVIYVATCVGACLGALAAKRKWVDFDQVLISIGSAGVVALLAIVDYNLADTAEQSLNAGESFYYLGWVFGLWFAPFILVNALTRDSARGYRMAGGLLIVAVVMAMVGLLAGVCVEVLVKVVDWADEWCCDWFRIGDNQRFWIARPVTTNTIGAAYLAVAFSTMWWPAFWDGRAMARWWLPGVSAATIAYAGLFGALFYEDGAEVSAVAGFLGFGALPGIVGLVTFAAGRSTRRESGDDGIGWPVSAWFWRWLPLGFGVGLGAVALWGLAPLGRQPADAPVFVLVTCHGLNGLFLGTALWAMPFAFGLMPDEGRP